MKFLLKPVLVVPVIARILAGWKNITVLFAPGCVIDFGDDSPQLTGFIVAVIKAHRIEAITEIT